MAEFIMPSLGADMESGTLLEWLVKPGDTVDTRRRSWPWSARKRATSKWRSLKMASSAELLVAEGAEVPVGPALAIILRR